MHIKKDGYCGPSFFNVALIVISNPRISVSCVDIVLVYIFLKKDLGG